MEGMAQQPFTINNQFQALNGSGPQYLSDMLNIRNISYGLRSTNTITLDVPRTKHKTLGDRAFKAAAPRLWNSLPMELRSITDISTFKRNLKTYYFNIAYP